MVAAMEVIGNPQRLRTIEVGELGGRPRPYSAAAPALALVHGEPGQAAVRIRHPPRRRLSALSSGGGRVHLVTYTGYQSHRDFHAL